MDLLLLTHIAAVSFWLGVIAVEFVFERASIDRSAKVLLHKLTDRYAELPVITVVLTSGLMLWARSDWALYLLPKVAFGVLAVGANAVCYYFVEKRTAEKSQFLKESSRIGWATVPALAGIVGAAILGLTRV